MQGWIKLHRKTRDHWLFTERRVFSRLEAWVDLLLEVNHKEHKFLLGSELVEVKAGQTITSIRKLCERWCWSNSKVTNFLKLLEKDGMLLFVSDTKKTTLTIVNYEVYQTSGVSQTMQESHANDEEKTKQHTNKNVKNDENDNNETYSTEFELFWDLYPKKVEKKSAYIAFKKAIKNHSLETITMGTQKYAKDVQGRDKQFVKNPATFLINDSFIGDFGEGGVKNGANQTPEEMAVRYHLDF
ncbi:hypothetical protein [Paenisporosarcina indica]|uniref:hypothetical protein n=1 Tax=Paenisporosarcina indica TaxID=650093 RepID=UPI00094FE944|nr:hypothetical protein [Paenisporosarcina indica]